MVSRLGRSFKQGKGPRREDEVERVGASGINCCGQGFEIGGLMVFTLCVIMGLWVLRVELPGEWKRF